MICEKYDLKEKFPVLAATSDQPSVTVYLPDNITEMGRGDWKKPCMVICPGGGYGFCSQREAEPVALHFLTEGYNVFVLNYSVSPYRFPVQLQEVAAVLELIYENAAQWYCDTSKVAIMGFSAGGHLTAHYCNRYACPEVRERFPDSKGINACILGYPVITADPRYSHKGSFEKLNGGTYPEGEMQDFYSCNKMVTEQTPPTFLWHCTGDKTVPVKNSLLYADAMAENGVPFEMHIYPGGKHGLGTADLVTNLEIKPGWENIRDWLDALRKWLARTLHTEQ